MCFWFLRLGLTSFGGPVAHLGYFREEFVVRKKWLSEQSYADIVALCQFLPGPASSQVGLAIGILRAGYRGAFAAWAGFTLPSALALTLFAISLANLDQAFLPGVLQGLKIVAVAVVAQAVWGMAKNLCPDALRATLMAMCACFVLLAPYVWIQVGVIVAAGVAGLFLFKPQGEIGREALPFGISRQGGLMWLSLFCWAGRLAVFGAGVAQPISCPVRCLLPGRFFGFWRWSCGPALAAGRSGAARLGG